MFLNEKETDSFGAERNLHYICGANGLAAIYVTTADKDTMYYAYTDYQHNLLALTDAAGKPYARFSYDPWGNRRSATDWTQSDTLTHHIINRGYTMHEHLDEFGLINMNGRMYDPKLACFLSPDPVISDAGNWLDYNRYSYAWGNPLKYCDPTGMWEATDNERTSKIYVDNLLYDPLRDQKDKKNFDWSDILNLKEGHYENSNGELIKTDDLKKLDDASANTSYDTGTSTTKNTSAEQQQNKMTVTTPNDLNKPQDSGNWTEKAGTAVETVKDNKFYGTAMAMNSEFSIVSESAQKAGYTLKLMKGVKTLGVAGTAVSVTYDTLQLLNGTADTSTYIDLGINTTLFILTFTNPVTAATLGTIYCIYTLTNE